MLKKLKVYFKDKTIGELVYNGKYNYIPFKGNEKENNNWYRVSNADKDEEWFRRTLENSRCIDPNRVNLREVLSTFKMNKLDPFEYMYKSRFTSATDFFWASDINDSEDFWLIHPLAVLCDEYEEKINKLKRKGITLESIIQKCKGHNELY